MSSRPARFGSALPSVRRAAAACTLALAACAGGSDAARSEPLAPAAAAHGHHSAAKAAPKPGPGVERQLAALRAATAAFHSLSAAQDAGYRDRVTGCMSDPAAGGMGEHHADLSRFDAAVEATRPEILVYAPGPNGQLRLVAVEYAVPLSAWTGDAPPELYGVPFHVNAAFGLWVLHAWVWAPNPSGVFADWNPRVSCAGAS